MWCNIIAALYPAHLSGTYCVPPVHFNRVPYARANVPGTGQAALVVSQLPCTTGRAASAGRSTLAPVGQSASALSSVSAHRRVPLALSLMPDTPDQYSLWPREAHPQSTPPARVQESDLRDDFAQRHVLANLQALGRRGQGEVMFIISQLNFGSYLSQPCYSAAAASTRFPTVSGLEKPIQRGEFDILLIHRRYGVLIGELKSVGKSQVVVSKTQAQVDADVAKRMRKSVKQLDKSETVVRHLVSDVHPGLTVRKTLFLPYVSREQLKRVLVNDPQLEMELCQSLGASDAEEATELCCCSDDLSDPATYWDVTPDNLASLDTWWQHRMTSAVDAQLTDDVYLDLVARFVGPATSVNVHCNVPPRVEVRTMGEAVSELGRRLSCLVLTQQQIDLMHRAPPKVCICGPPGTGKTVMLIMIGLRWRADGRKVYVVSSRPGTLGASKLIQYQIEKTLDEDSTVGMADKPGVVKFCNYDLYNREEEVDRAVDELAGAAEDESLHVIMDEAKFGDRTSGSRLRRLVRELSSRIPNLHLWAAQVVRSDIPEDLQLEELTTPLRCSPAVVQEVQSGFSVFNNISNYDNSGVPSPGDGLTTIRLNHRGNDHTGRWPVECYQCGLDVAKELRSLGVGLKNRTTPNSPDPLSFRDVFVLTRNADLQDDVIDDAGNVTSQASGVVRGLRAAKLPVRVLGTEDADHGKEGWEGAVTDTALAESDRITVAHWLSVSGLERKVVVWLAGRDERYDHSYREERIEAGDRLHVVSRCTSQLLVVEVPRETAAGQKDDGGGGLP